MRFTFVPFPYPVPFLLSLPLYIKVILSSVRNTTGACFFAGVTFAQEEDEDVVLEEDIGKSRDGSRTDDEVVQR